MHQPNADIHRNHINTDKSVTFPDYDDDGDNNDAPPTKTAKIKHYMSI